MEKSKIKTLLITFYDSKGIIHKEFVPPGKTVDAVYFLGVMKRLLAGIRRVRPEYRESGSWRLLDDNAPSHRSTLVTNFFIENHILTLNHSLYSPDLAPCDFYLFGKLHLAMKGKRYKDVEHIQMATTSILKMIPANDLKSHLICFLNALNSVLTRKGTILKPINKFFKNNYLLPFF